MTPEHAAARGRVYREHLDDLTEGQWAHAVQERIKGQRFFPTVSELREAASGWKPELPQLGAGDCRDCDGVGWVITDRDGREYAKPCPCRPRMSA